MALLAAGCQSIPSGAERGPNGTIAYYVSIDATPPGAKIEANGETVGTTPLQLKIFGDTDGTFHDFGADFYVIRALPVATNQYVQTRFFGTGRWFGPEDRIPRELHFDMNTPAPPPTTYGYPMYGPPVYYGPPPVYFYGPGPYYGPSFRFYFGPRPYYWHHRH